jgi:hypothetical protein
MIVVDDQMLMDTMSSAYTRLQEMTRPCAWLLHSTLMLLVG